MSEAETHLKSARTSRLVGVFGALAMLIGFAWLSYVLKGEILWFIMLLAIFTAACHFFGCELFVRHFKALAKEVDNEGQ